MTERDITNLLFSASAVALVCKMKFYFRYLKVVDKNIKESDLISFSRRIDLANFILLVLPFFFSRKSTQDDWEVKRAKMKARISNDVLLALLIMTVWYLYRHP